MRVFISSTVYDLIDIRAEVAEQLRIMGIDPVLSDDKLSDFNVQHDVNSIETCLINVDSCDEFILILDQRYGPTLKKYGYGDFSATHLEYQRATKKNIPVRVYVRDRLLADFSFWKSNGRNDSLKLPWVSHKDIGLLKLLDAHSPLESDSTKSNWIFTFTNSVDLKKAINKHFESRILPQRLIEAIQNNTFPLFDIEVKTVLKQELINIVSSVTAYISNISRAPAFKLYLSWENNEKSAEREIFLPGQSISMGFICEILPFQEIERFLILEYENPIGVLVRDRFRVAARNTGSAVVKGGSLVDRKFRRSTGFSLEIEDV